MFLSGQSVKLSFVRTATDRRSVLPPQCLPHHQRTCHYHTRPLAARLTLAVPPPATPQDDDATAALLWMARHDAGSEDNAAEAAALWEGCGAALRRSALDKLVPREWGMGCMGGRPTDLWWPLCSQLVDRIGVPARAREVCTASVGRCGAFAGCWCNVICNGPQTNSPSALQLTSCVACHPHRCNRGWPLLLAF